MNCCDQAFSLLLTVDMRALHDHLSPRSIVLHLFVFFYATCTMLLFP